MTIFSGPANIIDEEDDERGTALDEEDDMEDERPCWGWVRGEGEGEEV